MAFVVLRTTEDDTPVSAMRTTEAVVYDRRLTVCPSVLTDMAQTAWG